MNYPDGRKRNNKIVYSGKRGMTLENDINDTNKYYLDKDIALIYKKHTPTKVTKLVGNRIKDGFYEIPSTTDYNGIYKSKYIDFEAKETKSKTSFSLNNIHDHQIKHLDSVLRHGGTSFLIIRFTAVGFSFELNERNTFVPCDIEFLLNAKFFISRLLLVFFAVTVNV